MTETAAARSGALSGLRVLELCAFVAAPLAGLTLAQLGAEVTRVDLPGGNADIGRLPLAPSGRSLYWASLNAGKRSAEVDFRTGQGQALIRDWLAQSGPPGGIVVTNLPLDEPLGYEALRAAREDLIYVQLKGSPDDRSEFDYTVNCAVGFPLVTGSEGAQPVNHVLPAWDVIAGLMLANAVLAAVLERTRTGRGQRVELALSDVAMATVANLGYLAEAQINGTERLPDANFLYGAYGDAFRTRNGRYMMVAAITDRQWRNLLVAVDLQDKLPQAASALGLDLTTQGGRYAARHFVSAALRPWFAARGLDEAGNALERAGVLWGPYRSFRQLLAEDRRCSTDNPMFGEVTHPGIGTLLAAGSPLRFSAFERIPSAAAPELGRDTDALRREARGAR